MAKLPINVIHVVGAGGNGSIFMTHLSRIQQAWVKLGGQPFAIHLFDPDVVSEANLARQCFCEADIGLPKAVVLSHRLRGFFGTLVTPHVEEWPGTAYCKPDVVVGCVDNIKARRRMAKPHSRGDRYYLDLGNDDNTGQVVLGGHGLKNVFDVFPQLKKAKEKKTLPSCSMAESLSRQDLFINPTIASLGGHLLWRLMRNGGLNHHGYVVNLNEGLVLPIAVEHGS